MLRLRASGDGSARERGRRASLAPASGILGAALAVWFAASPPAGAQDVGRVDALAQQAAREWASSLFSQIYHSPHKAEAGTKLALQPPDRRPGLRNSHRWRIYEWMVSALKNESRGYTLVDQARVADLYHVKEQSGLRSTPLMDWYKGLLREQEARITVTCRGAPADGGGIILHCSATDIETNNLLGRKEIVFTQDWLRPVTLDYALHTVAGEVAAKLGGLEAGRMGEVRIVDDLAGEETRLSKYVARKLNTKILRRVGEYSGWRGVDAGSEGPAYRLEGELHRVDEERLEFTATLLRGDTVVPGFGIDEVIDLAEVPARLLVKSARAGRDGSADAAGESGTVPVGTVVLPGGYTVADWVLMAEDRLERRDFARLLAEAKKILREHGARQPVEDVRERAISGMTEDVRLTTKADAPEALARVARIEAAAGKRPALSHLRARAHRLAGDARAEEAALEEWLALAPQDHPERLEVLRALTRARALAEQPEVFAERVGRPFSTGWKDEATGWTDLHFAALLDLPAVAAALIEAGTAPDARLKDDGTPFGDGLKRTLAGLHPTENWRGWEADGETPLMIAALADSRAAAAALAARGADVNAKNNDGGTPLHHAAWKNAREVAEWLVGQGADIHAKEDDGDTPLHDAALGNAREVAEWLVGQGADINAKDNDGRTPLHYAARRNAREVAEWLVGQGADVNGKDNDGWTALHWAALGNSREVGEWLVGQGADVNGKDNDGWTPLHWAALGNLQHSRQIAEWLVGQGADVNAKNNAGQTPLHTAAYQHFPRSREVGEWLVGQGADVNAKDNDGDTPLDIAISKGRKKMQAILRRLGGR